MKFSWFAGLAAGLVLTAWAAAAQEILAHGLRHRVLTNAAFGVAEESPLIITNLLFPTGSNRSTSTTGGVFEPFVISIELGESTDGVFVYPNEIAPVVDGDWMHGAAYGMVNGVTNELISRIRGERVGWGEYDADIDFTPLGATSLTYRVYCGRTVILQVTNRAGRAHVSTYNVVTGPPRVNPFTRLTDGMGAVIEFPGPTHFYLLEGRTNLAGVEYGASAVGQRIEIVAERVTRKVGFVSRVDVTTAGTLESYAINDERLGMFRFPHKALGAARFEARDQTLTLTNLVVSSDDGVLVDFADLLSFEMQLQPLTLGTGNAAVVFGGTGSSSSSPMMGAGFLGPVGIEVRNGVSKLTGGFFALGSYQVQVMASMNGLVNGTATVSWGDVLGTFTNRMLEVTAFGAFANGLLAAPGLFMGFAAPVTLQMTNGVLLTGNRFELTPVDALETVGGVESFHLLTRGVDSFTITNEVSQSQPVPPMELAIESQGNGVLVSWPYEPCYYLAHAKDIPESPWRGYGYGSYTNFQQRFLDAPLTNATRFYRLQHIYNSYISADGF